MRSESVYADALDFWIFRRYRDSVILTVSVLVQRRIKFFVNHNVTNRLYISRDNSELKRLKPKLLAQYRRKDEKPEKRVHRSHSQSIWQPIVSTQFELQHRSLFSKSSTN